MNYANELSAKSTEMLVLKMIARRITNGTKSLDICRFRSRFMARTLYQEGARHDFVPQDVSCHLRTK